MKLSPHSLPLFTLHSLKSAALVTSLILGLSACEGKKTELKAKEAPLAVGNAQEPINPIIKIGVEPCDKLLSKYRACLTQLPLENRLPLEKGMVKAEETWKTLAQEEGNTQKLTEACLKMDNSLAETMTAQGCSWE